MSWHEPTWVDLLMLGVLLLSIVVGFLRGVVLELLSLAGWFAAWFAGSWLAPWIAPHLPIGAAGSALNHGAAFTCAFIAVLILWGLAAKLVSMLVKATPLRPLDRLLGAVFGSVRAVVLLLIAVMVVSWTPAATSPSWRASHAVKGLQALLPSVLMLLPAPGGSTPPDSARIRPRTV